MWNLNIEINASISEQEFKEILNTLNDDNKDSSQKFRAIKTYIDIDKCRIVNNGFSHTKKEIHVKIKDKE